MLRYGTLFKVHPPILNEDHHCLVASESGISSTSPEWLSRASVHPPVAPIGTPLSSLLALLPGSNMWKRFQETQPRLTAMVLEGPLSRTATITSRFKRFLFEPIPSINTPTRPQASLGAALASTKIASLCLFQTIVLYQISPDASETAKEESIPRPSG